MAYLTKPLPASTPEPLWTPGPLRPSLGHGEVHVWRANLDAVSDEVAGLLSPDERTRAERFLRARDGRRWARARGVLRALLGRYLERDPRSVFFTNGPNGKPALLGDGDRAAVVRTSATAATQRAPRRSASLAFNISHSDELAVCAFTEAGAVGVDVEVIRKPRTPRNEVAIAARAFGSVEAALLQGIDSGEREREFLRAWTQHEAKVKWRGRSIGDRRADTNGYKPWTAELQVSPGAVGAIAMEHPPRRVLCWEWRTGTEYERQSDGSGW